MEVVECISDMLEDAAPRNHVHTTQIKLTLADPSEKGVPGKSINQNFLILNLTEKYEDCKKS